MYTYKKQLANPSNYGGSRDRSAIKYIVLHYTSNDGDTDEANARYFQTAGRGASAHYFVDDDSVTQSVSDLYVAWSVGGLKWDDCSKTGGGTLYGKASNANSISIELCDTQKDGTVMASEKTLENAVLLIRELMIKYNVPLERVIRHFDVNGKHCPAYFLDSKKWQEFKSRISGGKVPASEAPAPQIDKKEEKKLTVYEVTAPAGLNVRSGPGTKYRKLYALSKGSSFLVDWIEGEWAHGHDNLKREGYVFTKWLQKRENL